MSVYRDQQRFVDSVRTKGYITQGMYEEFNRQLGLSLHGYELKMEHRHKVYQPEYADTADPTTFLNQYNVVDEAFYTDDILESMYGQQGTGTNFGDRRYYLESGDYFSVQIKSSGELSSGPLERLLYGESQAMLASPLIYGGMVLNEDY